MSCSLNAQNLISPKNWQTGTGSVDIFSQNGATDENRREWGDNPFGVRSILWKATPNGSWQADGGWATHAFSIDHTQMYRYVVWIKKNNSHDGITYLGCYSYPETVLTLSGSSQANPYFWHGDLPKLDQWYLLVGYIHGSGDDSTINYGGIYDGETGEKVVSTTDFKFPTTATSSKHRTYLYYDTNVSDRQYFYAPRVDVVNGDEPSIANLLGLNSKSIIDGDKTFNGRVAIKTSIDENYDLNVKGTISASEIKVEAKTADFVFEEDYPLRPIAELEEFVKANKHLPEIAPAKEMQENGVNQSEMNQKLLQKIEELTLYTIDQERKLNDKNKVIEQLNKRMSKLESLMFK